MKHIPDITSDKALVSVVDELKYRLKSGGHSSPMTESMHRHLNEFIDEFELSSQHHYAELKEGGI